MSNKRYSKYKPSPLPWNKEIPEHWISRRGKFIFKVINQRSEAGAEELLSVTEKWGVIPRKNANVTMFQAESYEGYKLCQKGDLVINSLWAWGKGLGFSEYAGIVSTAYSVYRLKKHSEHNYRYYNYLLRTPGYVGEYLVRSKGVWISRLQLSDMAFLDMQIVIPPLEEQTAIANYLDVQNEKINLFIANKKKLIELIIEQKQAIINSLLQVGTNKWRKYKLKFLCKMKNGFAFDANNFKEEGTQIIKIGNLYKNKLSLERDPTFVDAELFEELNDFQVLKGDILISLTGTLGKRDYGYAVLVDTEKKLLLNQRVAKLIPNEKMISKEFFLNSLLGNFFLDQLFSKPAGTKQANLGNDMVLNSTIHLPSFVEQEQIVKSIKSETSKLNLAITRVEKEIELIREYRQSIVAEVVTGKIKVARNYNK
jgi:type I restriction enzyme S subunit